jgi:hypothetical protein
LLTTLAKLRVEALSSMEGDPEMNGGEVAMSNGDCWVPVPQVEKSGFTEPQKLGPFEPV